MRTSALLPAAFIVLSVNADVLAPRAASSAVSSLAEKVTGSGSESSKSTGGSKHSSASEKSSGSSASEKSKSSSSGSSESGSSSSSKEAGASTSIGYGLSFAAVVAGVLLI